MIDLKDLRELTDKLNQHDEELQATNAILSSVAGITDGWFDWQVGSEDEFLSDNFKLQLGYKPDEMANKVSSWQNIIYQEDLDTVYKELQKHFDTKGEYPFQTTCRYTHKSGAMIRVLCRGKVIEWDGDKPVRLVGVHIKL
jgi:PAS domain S-box-containing protein